MPIDPDKAVGAALPSGDYAWTDTDVLLYHLAVGARPDELHYVYEQELRVLPTFATVIGTLRDTRPPAVSMPGIDVDLARALHGRHELILHEPLPPSGQVHAEARVADVYDKGSAAVIVTETRTPYYTNRTSIFARGEGGFGGDRGPSTRVEVPDRDPDAVVRCPTSPAQALWYRLCGDRNPLHVDPAFAARAGFPRPILHGLCTYGMVGKAVVDTLLDGDPTRVAAYRTRFAGVVYPGETVSVRMWRDEGRVVLTASVDERDDAPALADTEITVR